MPIVIYRLQNGTCDKIPQIKVNIGNIVKPGVESVIKCNFVLDKVGDFRSALTILPVLTRLQELETCVNCILYIAKWDCDKIPPIKVNIVNIVKRGVKSYFCKLILVGLN